eukprot:7390263-Prymnesium_polylepis.1
MPPRRCGQEGSLEQYIVSAAHSRPVRCRRRRPSWKIACPVLCALLARRQHGLLSGKAARIWVECHFNPWRQRRSLTGTTELVRG